ncbi:MAG: choloylglycine hydrolase [Thermodesulfobacteriota bacterium]|nr:MAG: choloylglycine hydrolase [Thermodesulfobacteriota bacterium]
MRTVFLYISILLILFSTSPLSANACTEFRLTSKDNSVVIGRSMEFAQKLNSNVIVQPKGEKRTSKLPDGSNGKEWTSKYGVIYLDGFGLDIAADGFNEAGLSVGELYFPGEAKFVEPPKKNKSKAISNLDLPLYILQNFATIKEVKKELPQLTVWGEQLEVLNNIVVPVHYAVYQSDGKGIVIEYTDQGLTIFDSVGVMTNSPRYDWHVTNLRNYVDLNAENVPPAVIDGVSFAGTGQGTGLKGIPGDPTPPSRFVRAAAIAYLSEKGDTAADIVNLSEHILNNVDIPIGLVRDFEDGETFHDYTQWVVIKDLTNKILYYRSYENMSLRSVDMNKLDMSSNGKRLKFPVNGLGSGVVDITSELKADE